MSEKELFSPGVATKVGALFRATKNYDWDKAKEHLSWFAAHTKTSSARTSLEELSKASPQQLQVLAPRAPECVREIPAHTGFEDLVLSLKLRADMRQVIHEYNCRSLLQEAKVHHSSKLLLHGPPGCGKTSIAHALADELAIPFFMASHATTIDSHLGETAKNMEKLFQFAESQECVLLFDEFDSIATQRGGPNEVGEMGRVVNMLLTRMEHTQFKGLFVACTNRFENLDRAILRRFDKCIEIPTPERWELVELAERLLTGLVSDNPAQVVASCKTPAEVSRRCQDILRNSILKKNPLILPASLLDDTQPQP